jgi:hypothetical protein
MVRRHHFSGLGPDFKKNPEANASVHGCLVGFHLGSVPRVTFSQGFLPKSKPFFHGGQFRHDNFCSHVYLEELCLS